MTDCIWKCQVGRQRVLTLIGLALIMAVLEKRCGLPSSKIRMPISSRPVVSNWTNRPLTLSVAVAIASSYKELPTNPQEALIGEIGLTGEIRRVTRIEQRINEAAKLGFTKIYAPENSLQGIAIPDGIQVIAVSTVGEVLKVFLNSPWNRLQKFFPVLYTFLYLLNIGGYLFCNFYR